MTRGLRCFNAAGDSYAKFLGTSDPDTESNVSTATLRTLEFFFLMTEATYTDNDRIFEVREKTQTVTRTQVKITGPTGARQLTCLFRNNLSTSNAAFATLSIDAGPTHEWRHGVMRDTGNDWEVLCGKVGDGVENYEVDQVAYAGSPTPTGFYPIGSGPANADDEGLTAVTIGDARAGGAEFPGLIGPIRAWTTMRTDTQLGDYSCRAVDPTDSDLAHLWLPNNVSGDLVDYVAGVDCAYTLGSDGSQGYSKYGFRGYNCHPFLRPLLVAGGC
ncbi:MAG: hypothetical protein AAF581_19475 [Planctomycetota bacterium]